MTPAQIAHQRHRDRSSGQFRSWQAAEAEVGVAPGSVTDDLDEIEFAMVLRHYDTIDWFGPVTARTMHVHVPVLGERMGAEGGATHVPGIRSKGLKRAEAQRTGLVVQLGDGGA